MVVYRTMKILFLFVAYVGCCEGNVDYSSYDYDYSEVEVLTNAPPYRPSTTTQTTNNQEDGFDGDIRDSDENQPHEEQPLPSLPNGEPPYSIAAMRDWISQHPGYPPLREEPDIGSRPATPSQPSPPSRPVQGHGPLGQQQGERSGQHQGSQPQREEQRPDAGSRPATPSQPSPPSRPAQDHSPLGQQEQEWSGHHQGSQPQREEPTPDTGSRPAIPSQPSPPSRPAQDHSPLGQQEREWSGHHQGSQPQREGQRPDTGSRPATPSIPSRPSRPVQDHRPLGHQQNPGIQILDISNIPTGVILGQPGIFHQLPRQEHPTQPLAPQADEVGQENVEGQGVQRKSPRSLRL